MTTLFSLPSIIRLSAIGCGLIGGISDMHSRRIPNWLTGPCILLGFLLHLLAGGWEGALSSLLGVLLCGGLFFLLYLAGGMGAGDVKFIAAEASLLGLSCSGSLLLYTVSCGGVMGLALALQRGKLGQTLSNVIRLTLHHGRHGLQPHPDLNVLNQDTLRLPYGVAIALGCMFTLYLQFSTWALL